MADDGVAEERGGEGRRRPKALPIWGFLHLGEGDRSVREAGRAGGMEAGVFSQCGTALRGVSCKIAMKWAKFHPSCILAISGGSAGMLHWLHSRLFSLDMLLLLNHFTGYVAIAELRDFTL